MEKQAGFQSLVESIYPTRLLLDLGLYVQTCSQIEFMACALICAFEDLKHGEDGWQCRHNELRKLGTTELIKQLWETGAQRNYGDLVSSGDLKTFVEWVDRFKINRHMAVHGTLLRAPNGEIFVNYVHREGSRKHPVYRVENTKLTPQIARELIFDADRILRILSNLAKKIDSEIEVAKF